MGGLLGAAAVRGAGSRPAGIEETRAVYREAIARKYRFYSFGDAMLVL